MAYVSLCKALYDYTATAEDELSFTEDALLYVVEAEDPEWWKAKLKSGSGEQEQEDNDDDDDQLIGLIPSNYVEEAEPVRASRALYDYEKQNDDELDIQEDEMLSIYEVKGDWLLAKRQTDGVPTGKLGFVPANYVDKVCLAADPTRCLSLKSLLPSYFLQVAAVDGVTSAPLGAAAVVEEQEDVHEAAIPLAPPVPSGQKTSKNDDIKMWAVSVSLARYQ